MNILYVHNVAKIGGAERVTLDIIKGLPAEHKAFLVTPEDGPLIDIANDVGAQAQPLDIHQPALNKPLATLRNHRIWLRYLRKNQIELIHTGDLFVTRTLIYAANKLNIPIICHVHFPIELPALRWIFKSTPKQIQFIYCSQELNAAVQPRIDTLMAHATHTTIHNGVDTDIFKKFEPKAGILPEGKTNIGIIANLQERKGHLDFINAANLVLKTHPNAHFHIIGGDILGEPREPLLRQRIDELGLDANFTFHGQVNNVKDYLNELDIFVCASHEEAFPISILEAMAFGLPIVSTNVNGIPEAIEHGANGLLCEAKQPEGLAAQLLLVLNDAKLSARISEQARSDAASTFSLNAFASQVQQNYESVGEAMA